MRRPKVGIVFIGHEFARVLGQSFVRDLEEAITSIKESLRSFADVVGGELVLNEQQAIMAAQSIRAEDVDLLIVCYMMFGSDKPLFAILREMDVQPLLVWCYSPRRKLPERMTVLEMNRGSSVVGTLMNASIIRRLGRDFLFVVGKEDDEKVVARIQEYSDLAKLANELREIRIGLLPSSLEENSAMWVDESELLRRIGPRVRHVSVGELFDVSRNIDSNELSSYVKYLKENFQVIGVSDGSLQAAAKASLGMAKIAEKYGLEAIALNDLDEDLHKSLKLRPTLYVESMSRNGVVIGAEGDVCGTLSTLILQKLTGMPAMFSEIFNLDEANNSVLMGHIGMANVTLASNRSRVRIVPDPEFGAINELEGACMAFNYREGNVTLFSLVSEDQSFRMLVSKGKSLPIDEKLEGFPHLLVKLDRPLAHFLEMALNSGANQHWAVGYGDVASRLQKLATIMKLEMTLI